MGPLYDDEAVNALTERLEARASAHHAGIWVPAGWVGIISDLEAALADILPDHKIGQVKEKFGTLRYYLDDHGTPHPDWPPTIPVDWVAATLIADAENRSAQTCMTCGRPGRVRSSSAAGYGRLSATCAACYTGSANNDLDETLDGIGPGRDLASAAIRAARERRDLARDWLSRFKGTTNPAPRADVIAHYEEQIRTAEQILDAFNTN